MEILRFRIYSEENWDSNRTHRLIIVEETNRDTKAVVWRQGDHWISYVWAEEIFDNVIWEDKGVDKKYKKFVLSKDKEVALLGLALINKSIDENFKNRNSRIK